MKLKAPLFALVVAIAGCSAKPNKPVAAQPLTPEQQQALEAQRKANEELLRKNNEEYLKAKADHPEAFSH